MRRREFMSLLCGSAAAWPLAARAQQPAMSVIGYLSGGAPGPFAANVTAFKEGLKEAGYVEGHNATIEYRWAEGQYDRLPALAAELVGRKVDLITASGGDLAAHAAKGATSTTPVVFISGDDPVATGLVASLARPGGNLTGFAFLVVELHPKRLELMSELVPLAKVMGLLVNPGSPQTRPRNSDDAGGIAREGNSAPHPEGRLAEMMLASDDGVAARLALPRPLHDRI